MDREPVVIKIPGGRHINIVFDFHAQRGLVKDVDLDFVDGIFLEDIEKNKSGKRFGVVLVDRGWMDVYFVNYRPRWEDERYFALAHELLAKKCGNSRKF